jgi:hypothetical protein
VKTREVLRIVGSGRSDEAVSPQALQKEPFSLRIGESGLACARTTCTSKSRSAISRFDQDRRSECGQVARIQRIGTPAFGVSSSRNFGVADPRTAKSRSDVAAWDPAYHSGVQVAHLVGIAVSVLGDLIGKGSALRVEIPRD